METFPEYDVTQLVRLGFKKLNNILIQNKTQKKQQNLNVELKNQNKKTFFVNFQLICTHYNRHPLLLKEYIENMHNTTSSVMESGILLINGIYRFCELNNTVQMYYKTYVLCKQKQCGGKTIVESINKKKFNICQKCNSRYIVS